LGFLIALQFLTRIPVTINTTLEENVLARSMIYYPLVGLFIGGLTALVQLLFSFVFSAPVADLAAIVFLVSITGNLHLDGLMDTADGLLSGKPREEALRIMRDSRVGSHGVIVGFLILLAKYVLLTQIPSSGKPLALLLMPLFGRWSLVYAAALFPYLRKGQGAGSFTQNVGKRELLLASAITFGVYALVPILLLPPTKNLLLPPAILAGTAAFGSYIYKKLGGMTGDTMGAMNEFTEVLFLLISFPLLFK
jgi:adenosylcobinamide-GDP ribazoletransferase